MDVRNEIDSKPSTLIDVIGVMPGKGPEADKYIILGNHRDAWIQGASDPHSGTVVLQGVAYLLGLAYNAGISKNVIKFSEPRAMSYASII